MREKRGGVDYTSDEDIPSKSGKGGLDISMQRLNNAMENASGLRMGEGSFNSSMTFKQMNKGIGSRDKEEIIVGSLTERATKIVNSKEYKQKLADIRNGKSKCKYMDFVMDGIKIGMPYNGQKQTSGYLKKETKSIGILLKKSWQLKYCVLDLTQFVFKYAKNPTTEFTKIHLKQIIDVVVEDDPKTRSDSKSIFSLGR